MQKIKEIFKYEKINLENILCIFIILSPILDMVSFLYRNIFDTNFSPATITRPIIPIIVMIYLFFKKDRKFKLYSIIVGTIYGIYAIIHLYLFTTMTTQSSYSNVIHEMQYIINYTFMILNLFIYIYIFKNSNVEKLKKSILYASTIYIASIFIAIATNTSSHTYVQEKIGYKGWFESGNSISCILLLSMFIIMGYIKDKKYRKIAIPLVILIGIFMTTLIGTRVGLYGYILVLFIFIIAEIINSLIHSKKINKKLIISGIIGIVGIITVVLIVGSSTLQRRNHLKEIEKNIVDTSINQESHITGSLLEIKEKIDNNTLEDGYMNNEQKQSILDLYNIANDLGIKNNDQRMQQLIYNIQLVKNQASPILITFGNGYMNNFRELVLEMEVVAILLNFGLVGFTLYLLPFVLILIYAFYLAIRNIRKIDNEFILTFLGCMLAFALSFLSGYVFFNVSATMIIIVLNVNLLSKCKTLNNKLKLKEKE